MKPAVFVSAKSEARILLERVREITEEVIKEIQAQYLEDSIPWVIGFSGGKDSTAVLQLVFYALSALPEEKLTKEVHILSNDTLVENPNIVRFLDGQLQQIEKAGKSELFSHNPNLFNVVKVTPKLEDTFWLNLIGKGYPSPNRWFRWCTERMKINPTSDYILKTVSRHGSAIILLGTRKAESANRANSMRQYEIQGLRLRQHTLPNAYVFAPIAEMTTKEVWAYLINTDNPWKINNQELLNLYRSASDVMECPLVIDDTTPSCGNSRFGCWVCTVVDQDKSMKKMIVNGEEWMQPLLDFRDWLREIRNSESHRDNRRRNGQEGLGPFTMNARKEILEKLLTIEKQVNQNLITTQELAAIQYQWKYDGNFQHSVVEIFNRVKGGNLMLPRQSTIEQRRQEEYKILNKVCKEKGVNPEHIRALLETERSKLSFLGSKRGNIFVDIKAKITEFVSRLEPETATDEN